MVSHSNEQCQRRVLLTGATGFLGRVCLCLMIEAGWDVHALSGRADRTDPSGTVTWHRGDLLDRPATHSLLEAIRPTHLLHLAWNVEHINVYQSPANDLWRDATIALTEDFAAVGGQRAVLVGTSAEYDWNAHGVFREDDDTTRAASRYGRAKADTDRATRALAETLGLSRAWARLFFLYGPGEPPGKLAASTIRALLAGEEARCSHGRQVRDFVFTEDAARALIAMLERPVEGAVNIASGQPVPLAALVNEAARQLDGLDRVRFGAYPSPANEAPLVAADITRLRDEVGYAPRVDIAEGVRRSIAWWRANATPSA